MLLFGLILALLPIHKFNHIQLGIGISTHRRRLDRSGASSEGGSPSTRIETGSGTSSSGFDTTALNPTLPRNVSSWSSDSKALLYMLRSVAAETMRRNSRCCSGTWVTSLRIEKSGVIQQPLNSSSRSWILREIGRASCRE